MLLKIWFKTLMTSGRVNFTIFENVLKQIGILKPFFISKNRRKSLKSEKKLHKRHLTIFLHFCNLVNIFANSKSKVLLIFSTWYAWCLKGFALSASCGYCRTVDKLPSQLMLFACVKWRAGPTFLLYYAYLFFLFFFAIVSCKSAKLAVS